MKIITIILALLVAALTAPHLYRQWKLEKDIRSQIDISVEGLDADDIENDRSSEQTGYVKVKGAGRFFTEKTLNRILRSQVKGGGHFFYSWNWQGIKHTTASARGIDGVHHFANSYLVGFVPFETKRVWVPLYTLAIRKRYEYDHIQYSGLADVWQNSRQAYYYTRGDCEDHAIVLADWLIGLGLDARVVTGRYKGQGHAWVVLVKDGKEYLLEATSKNKIRSLNRFPLAKMVSHYAPVYQFNRSRFWHNTGSWYTRKYTGPQWKLKSRFKKKHS